MLVQYFIPCVLFDYGMVKYLSSIGKTTDQIREFIPKNSVMWDIIVDILEAVHIPVALVDKIAIMLRERSSKQFKEYHDEIDAVDARARNPKEISNRLLIYPREGHGFTEKDHMIRQYRETIDFFNRYR